ncbi:MAG: retropepsin-like aspartic protease [Candidatus Caldarchaeum sp.]|nr:retropepsin-like aspartic protease [Candidatus Caldarchaeum sp.]
MGLVYVEAFFKSADKRARVNLLVESGATYTVLRREVWMELGLTPKREVELILADGSTERRQLSEVLIEIPGFGEHHTPVLLGEADDENILGIVNLEIFGLILDPLKRELRPMRTLLKSLPHS